MATTLIWICLLSCSNCLLDILEVGVELKLSVLGPLTLVETQDG